MPIAATILILVWIFTPIDNILQPLISAIWGRTVPGIGFGITIVLIYLAGVIASNIRGWRLIHYGESLLEKVPVVRPIYTGIKQILDSFSTSGKAVFKQVTLVEFPRKGMRTIGFITNESSDKSGEKLVYIFIPPSPNPMSGFLEVVREEEVIRTDISVSDALKMVISTGKVTPREVSDRLSVKKAAKGMNTSEIQERSKGMYERNRLILLFGEKYGISYVELGKKFSKGKPLSRQRVEQIIERLGGK